MLEEAWERTTRDVDVTQEERITMAKTTERVIEMAHQVVTATKVMRLMLLPYVRSPQTHQCVSLPREHRHVLDA